MNQDWANLWPEGRYFGTIEGGNVLIAIAQRVQKLEEKFKTLEDSRHGKRE